MMSPSYICLLRYSSLSLSPFVPLSLCGHMTVVLLIEIVNVNKVSLLCWYHVSDVYNYYILFSYYSLWKRKVDQYYPTTMWLHVSNGLISVPFLSCFMIYLHELKIYNFQNTFYRLSRYGWEHVCLLYTVNNKSYVRSPCYYMVTL